MSVVGINFGSATSGAGFDVSATVSSIMANARAPETVWAARASALTAQDTVLSTLGTNLSALSSALSSLTAFDGALSQKQGATSDSTLVALTQATGSAAAGTHTVTVQQLATTSQQHSSKIATGALLSGDLTLQVGNGPAHTVSLNTLQDKSVAGLAAAINALDAGVNATVIADNTGSYLSLTSASSGAAGEITTDSNSLLDSDGNPVSITSTQRGTDAQYTLDGIPLTSASNSVSGALPGVTFRLLGQTNAPVTVEVANDTSAVTAALSTFVTAYNTLTSALNGQEGKDAAGNAQPLFGDQTLSLIQSQLSNALAFVTGNTGRSSNLSQLGISVNTDGKLSLDGATLSSALTSNFAGVTNFFENAGDFAQNFASVLHGLSDSGQGALALRKSQNSSEERTLADNKTNLEARLVQYQASLTAQLNVANQLLQGIPSRLDEVDQIYSAITGYKKS